MAKYSGNNLDEVAAYAERFANCDISFFGKFIAECKSDVLDDKDKEKYNNLKSINELSTRELEFFYVALIEQKNIMLTP